MGRTWYDRFAGVAFALLYGGGVAIAMTRLTEAQQLPVGYAACALAALLAGVCIPARFRGSRVDYSFSWRFISWGMLAFALLALFRLLSPLLAHTFSSPLWAFSLFGLVHLLYWAGALTSAGRYPRTVLAWAGTLCDIVIAIGATAAIATVFELPAVLNAPGHPFVLTIVHWGYALSFPVGLTALILLLCKTPPATRRGTHALLALALALLLVGDGALAWLSLTGRALPLLIMLPWVTGCLLFAAALPQVGREPAETTIARPATPAHPLYAPLQPSLALLLWVVLLYLPLLRHPVRDAVSQQTAFVPVYFLALLLLRYGLHVWQSALAYRALHSEIARQQYLVYTDPLTGIANQRRLMARLADEMSRARRYNRHFAVVFLDIDFFKMVNDLHGHRMGDQVLCAVATLLRSTIRGTDLVARYGGEEFVLVLPETMLAEAGILAERLRECVKALRIPAGHAQYLQVTISLGVSAYPETTNTIESLLTTADDAMRQAKGAGRDRVVVSAAQQHLFIT